MQEVELLPTLFDVGSRNFPGQVESIFIINAGWKQRSLWSIIRPILPHSASDRVMFVDRQSQLEDAFRLDRVPIGTFLSIGSTLR